MRRLFFSLLVLGVIPSASYSVQAEETITSPQAEEAIPSGQIVTLELIDAHREYQAARMRLQEYRFVKLPQQRLLLDQHAKLTKTEIVMLKRRLHDYEPFLSVGEYSPVRTAAESHRLALLAAEQRLRQIEDGQRALLRLNRQQSQLYRLDVLRAATRIALERGEIARSLEK